MLDAEVASGDGLKNATMRTTGPARLSSQLSHQFRRGNGPTQLRVVRQAEIATMRATSQAMAVLQLHSGNGGATFDGKALYFSPESPDDDAPPKTAPLLCTSVWVLREVPVRCCNALVSWLDSL